MPTIFDTSNLRTTRDGGKAQTTLANAAMLGSEALEVERLTLEAGAHTSPASASGAENFLYVIRGGGEARVGSESFPLEVESMLWLEAGDSYVLEAGADGLQVLLCRAPAQAGR